MDQEKIGKIIKEIRKNNNLTQADLANKYNVTYQAVSKWENGKNIPDISILKQMSKDFNIDINLNNNAIKLNGQSNPEQNINVEIKKKDSIIYLTSVVEKEVPKYIKVRELPSVKENKTTCTDILQRLKQKQSEKINLSRN